MTKNKIRYIYYIDGERFTTDDRGEVLNDYVSSPDEDTPAFENLLLGFKVWCLKGLILHRLTGPARILSDGSYTFCLNGNYYKTVKEWIKDHPNPDLYFNTIGILTETDKILWFLQN
jgi:hypothetical protein